MRLTKDEYNRLCKQNYHKFHQRIQQLEESIKGSRDYTKIIQSVKQIQKELAQKDENRRPRVVLFDKGQNPTRINFFERLNSLFQSANQDNKQTIQQQLREQTDQLKQGVSPQIVKRQLINIQKRSYAIPDSDKDSRKIKNLIQEAFDSVKAAQTSAASGDPQLDQAIQQMEQQTQQMEQQIQSLGNPTESYEHYSQHFESAKQVRKELIKLQKSIHGLQIQVKQKPLDRNVSHQYFKQLQRCYERQNEFWKHPFKVKRETFCEVLSSSNFQQFATMLEEIEASSISNPDRNQIKRLNNQLKELEQELHKRDPSSNFLKPLKLEHLQEFYHRIQSCKRTLQQAWDQAKPPPSPEFDEINIQIGNLYKDMTIANSKHELEIIKGKKRQFDPQVKEYLKNQRLTLKQFHRLKRDLDHLYTEATQKIDSLFPQKFSNEWLIEAYQRNVENSWVIFVKEVPPIVR